MGLTTRTTPQEISRHVAFMILLLPFCPRDSWCAMLPPSIAMHKEDLMIRRTLLPVMLIVGLALGQQNVAPEKETSLKADVAIQIDGMKKQAQVMVDTVFSFAELGFQEVETSKYLTSILEKEGFRIQHGIAGVPTAWVATWGEGKPVISLGSDIDDIPQASQ